MLLGKQATLGGAHVLPMISLSVAVKGLSNQGPQRRNGQIDDSGTRIRRAS